MPLVTIALRPHPAEDALLAATADAVADALGLAAGDVIALATPVRSLAASGRGTIDVEWPIVAVHGSDRGEEPTARALAAAERTVLSWGREHRMQIEGVWTEWLLPLAR